MSFDSRACTQRASASARRLQCGLRYACSVKAPTPAGRTRNKCRHVRSPCHPASSYLRRLPSRQPRSPLRRSRATLLKHCPPAPRGAVPRHAEVLQLQVGGAARRTVGAEGGPGAESSGGRGPRQSEGVLARLDTKATAGNPLTSTVTPETRSLRDLALATSTSLMPSTQRAARPGRRCGRFDARVVRHVSACVAP